MKPDIRILVYGAVSLVLAFFIGPLGLFLGHKTGVLYMSAVSMHRKSPRSKYDPELAKVGSRLGKAAFIIGLITTAWLIVTVTSFGLLWLISL